MLQASLCTRISWVGSLPSDPAAATGVQSLCLLPNLHLFPHKRSSFCPCLDFSHMCYFLYKPLPMNLIQDTLHPHHGPFQQRYMRYFFPSIKITHFNHSKGSATILLRFRIIKKHLGKPSSFNSTHTQKPFLTLHHCSASCCPFSFTIIAGIQLFLCVPKATCSPLLPSHPFAAWLIPIHFSDLCSDTISCMRPDRTPPFPDRLRIPIGSVPQHPVFPHLRTYKLLNHFTT